MDNLLEILEAVLPEIIGGLILAAILAVIAALFRKRQRGQVGKTDIGQMGTAEVGQDVARLGSAPMIVSNLPARGEFVGRETERERILEGLRSKYPFVVILGETGIGKTALAREVGWILREGGSDLLPKETDTSYFEAIIWLEDHDGELTITELSDTIGVVLGYQEIARLPVASKRLEIAKQLQELRCLVIIDNFENVTDPEVKDFVMKMPAPMSRAILTTSSEAQWKEELRDDGWLVPLKKMSFEDSLALAHNEAKRLDARIVDGQDLETTLRKLCQLTGGHPYSIRVMVAQIQAGTPLDRIFATAGTDDKMLQTSWGLIQDNPSAVKVLMTMTLFQSPPTLEAIESVSGVAGSELARVLTDLDELHLMEIYNEADGRNYGLHPLTDAFVTKKLSEDQALSQALNGRMAKWIEAYVLEHGGPKNWKGYPMLDRQYAAIIAMVEWCSQQSPTTDERGDLSVYRAIDTFMSLGDNMEAYTTDRRRVLTVWRAIDHYMSLRGNMEAYIKLGNHALECAKSTGDADAEIDIKVEVLGFAYMTQGVRMSPSSGDRERLLKKAEALIAEGLEAYYRSANWAGVGNTNRYLGMIAQERGDYGSAKGYFEDSLASYESIPGWDNLGAVLSRLGILSLQQNDVESSEVYQSRRLSLAEALGNPEGMSVALYNLGRLAQIHGKDLQAADFYRRALREAGRARKHDVIAASKRRLAVYALQRGEIDGAIQMARDAYKYYESAGEIPVDLSELLTQVEACGKARTKLWQRLVRHIRRLAARK